MALTDKHYHMISVILALCAIVFTYAAMGDSFFDRMFNSDCMYLPSIFHEFFIEEHGISDLKFNGQPNFFPDMLVYFPIYAVTKSIVWSGILYSLLQVGIIMFLVLRLFQLLVAEELARTFSIIFNLLIIFSISLGTHSSLLSFHLLSNGFHTSAFTLTLWALVHFFKAKGSIDKSTIWLAIILLVGGLNDRLFFLMCGFPILIIIILMWFSRFKKSSLSVLFMLAGSLGVAYFSLTLIETLTNWTFISQDHSVSLDSFAKSRAMFVQAIKTNFFTFNPGMLIYWLGISSLAICVVRLIQHKHVKLNIVSISFFTVVLFAPVFLGMLDTPSKFRYSIFVFYFMPIPLLINTQEFFQSKKRLNINRATIAFALGICLTILSFSSKEKLMRRGSNYQPKQVRNLDRLKVKNPTLIKGISSYWNAKQTTYFSEEGLQVYACYYPNLQPEFYTGHNPSWYYGDNKQAGFNFIVMDNPNDTTQFKTLFSKKEVKVLDEKGTYIMQVPEFGYKKGVRGIVFMD
ncbi:MAG: hypothetical protein JKY42_11930 [Flavobacteriales bacterium]|nr:hypothetical protein [Flavobacteriales bacterium]